MIGIGRYDQASTMRPPAREAHSPSVTAKLANMGHATLDHGTGDAPSTGSVVNRIKCSLASFHGLSPQVRLISPILFLVLCLLVSPLFTSVAAYGTQRKLSPSVLHRAAASNSIEPMSLE